MKLLPMTMLGLLLSTSFLWASATQSDKKVKEEESITYKLGQMIAAEPFANINLTKKEKNDLAKGFSDGLNDPKSKDEIKAFQSEVNSFMRKKMNELKEAEDKARQTEMDKLTFPMDTEIESSDGKKHTVASLIKGKKALLLDFWATWCGPCVRLMPKLVEKEARLKEHGILVAGMNTENIDKAEGFRKDKNIEMTWLVEPEGRPFSKLLGINSIPRMILVSAKGKILYNGHPSSEGLHVALEKLGVPHQH